MAKAPHSVDVEALGRMVGPGGLVLDGSCGSYETPARYSPGVAALVVRPRTVAEVSAVIGYCMRRRRRVIPQGGNTGLVLGATPDATGEDIVLSIDRLRTIRRVSPEDRTACADAGVRLSELNDALDPHGLYLPIDLGADPMLGGMAATNAGGARFLRYGGMRAHVLGVELVLATEAAPVVTLGYGLRKDNSRPSLKDLVVGAGAAFGVITGVTTGVAVRPAQVAAAILVPDRPERCPEIVLQLERGAGEFLSAVEGMSGAAMSHALDHGPRLRNPFSAALPDYAVLVELSSSIPAAVLSLDDILLATLAPLLEGEDALLADAIVAPPAALWALRHGLSEGLRRAGDVIGLDLAFARDRIFAFRTAAARRLAELPLAAQICDFGHIADGGVHFNLVVDRATSAGDRARIREVLLELAVGEFGATFSSEHGLGRANQADYDRYVPAAERELAGRLTTAFGIGPCGHFRLGLPPGS